MMLQMAFMEGNNNVIALHKMWGVGIFLCRNPQRYAPALMVKTLWKKIFGIQTEFPYIPRKKEMFYQKLCLLDIES